MTPNWRSCLLHRLRRLPVACFELRREFGVVRRCIAKIQLKILCLLSSLHQIGQPLPAEEIDCGPFNPCAAVLGPSEARNRKDSFAKKGMRTSLGIVFACCMLSLRYRSQGTVS